MGLTQRRQGAKSEKNSFNLLLCALAPLRESFLLLVILVNATCLADEPPPAAAAGDESTQYVVETLLAGLDNPTGLALRPGAAAEGPFELHLSESGAGRVVRLSTAKPSEPTPVINGFPLGEFGAKPAFRVGPLAVEFLSPNRLAVATGGLDAGKELIHVYALPEDGSALPYDKFDHSVGPVAASNRSTSGEGDFVGLAKTEDALFVVPAAGDERGWVLKAILDANRLAGLEPFIATKTVAGVGAPRAVAINPKANYHYLVVGEAGEPSDQRDSRITMYSPSTGALALNLNTGLFDVAGLAYSPSGDLYALDFATANPNEGGVYRLEAANDNGRETCRPVKIAAIVRPTALAFTPDGTLYVAARGDGADGKLVKITPKPDTPKL